MKRPVRAEDGTYTIQGKKYNELNSEKEYTNNKLLIHIPESYKNIIFVKEYVDNHNSHK